ncbi:hypothetical protein SDC9_118264 [bioreactor metagenome]|uniref:Uncharacterized protein n=1 Tax=bioreactor metagenome TaxID=1076179 RepID=A0A645C0K5_9ZZZZ
MREQADHRGQQRGEQFPNRLQNPIQGGGQGGDNVFNDRRDILDHVLTRFHHVADQQLNIRVRVAQPRRQVADGGLHPGDGAADGLGRFLGGRARNAHFRLNDVNGRVYIVQIADVVLLSGQLFGVRKEPLHLGFCAAVAELEVVEHRVILLGKALIGVLNRRNACAHFVGVVRHVGNRRIRRLGRLGGVAAEGLDEAGRKARDRLHVLIGGHSGGLKSVGGIALDSRAGILEQRVHAAHQLFVVRVSGDDFLAKLDGGGTGGNYDRAHRHADALEDASHLFKLGAGFFRLIAAFPQFIS